MLLRFRLLMILMVGVAGPMATSHGGDRGGEDPRWPPRIPAQCDEPGSSSGRRRRGRKGNALRTLDELRKEAANGKISIEFNTIDSTYKAVGKNTAHFNNAIGIHTRDLLAPYYFRWSDNMKEDILRIWERMFDMFEMADCPANREAVFRQSRASMKDWKHDLKNHWKQMCSELGTSEAKKAKPESVRTRQDCVVGKRLSAKQKENYGKKKTKPTQGTKSFAAHRYDKTLKGICKVQLIIMNSSIVTGIDGP